MNIKGRERERGRERKRERERHVIAQSVKPKSSIRNSRVTVSSNASSIFD